MASRKKHPGQVKHDWDKGNNRHLMVLDLGGSLVPLSDYLVRPGEQHVVQIADGINLIRR